MDVTPSISGTIRTTIDPYAIGTWAIDDPIISCHRSRSAVCTPVYATAVAGIFEVLDPTIFHERASPNSTDLAVLKCDVPGYITYLSCASVWICPPIHICKETILHPALYSSNFHRIDVGNLAEPTVDKLCIPGIDPRAQVTTAHVGRKCDIMKLLEFTILK